MEQLETRLAPATFQWTGAAKDNHWSDAANWLENGVPAPTAPSGSSVSLDDLVFPAGVPQTSMVNDIGSDTLPATFGSLTFYGDNYSLTGFTLILGSTAVLGSGSVTVNAGLANETISLDGLQLGDSASDRQFFNIDSNAQLTLNTPLIGDTGVTLAKDLPGTLVLTQDDSQFTGQVSVDANGGVLQITNSKALGDGSNSTTVQFNAQLQVSNSSKTGLVIQEPLILNGSGISNGGALLNVAGNNTWTAGITLDSDVTLGATAGTSLDITGPINDGGAGHGITKEGAGTIIFANANFYRGPTTINNGILQIQNGAALGITDGTAATGTTVTQTVTAGGTVSKAGTLQLDFDSSLALLAPSDPNWILQDPTMPFNATTNPFVGFQVPNVQLTLNGAGALSGTPAVNSGAMDNLNGLNVWTGNVILGSPPPDGQDISIGVEATDDISTLTISGVVSEPNAPPAPATPYALHKIGPSELILTQPNTYTGQTFADAGILTITDSQALGAASPLGVLPLTTVASGATLELSVDGKTTADSLSGATNELWVSYPLKINGLGLNGLGALFSHSGVNTYTGTITLTGKPGVNTPSAIGVAADPNTSSDTSYFPTYNAQGDAISGDFSLTVTSGGLVGGNFIPGLSAPTVVGTQLVKVDGGQLILPTANDSFTCNIDIRRGWITVQNNDSLGGHIIGAGDTKQATVTVENGASLHLDGATGNLNIAQNLVLAGSGFTHNFSKISKMGAVENLDGINTLSGNVTLKGQVGIGVETVFGASDLTMTGSMGEKIKAAAIPVSGNASGGASESDNLIDTGSTSGTITVFYNMYYIPDQMDIYYGIYKSGGINIFTTGGPVSGTATVTVNYGPIGNFSSTFITIVMNMGGGQSGTAWTYTATIVPNSATSPPGGITKLGSQKLNIEGDGTYTGPVDVKQGVLRAQNNTALGAGTAATNTTTVETGAALELGQTIPQNNGGITEGLQVPPGEHLILNGQGVTDPNAADTGDAPLTILPNSDHLWQGPITLDNSVPIFIDPTSQLNLTGVIDDTPVTSVSGAGITMTGGGELQLGGANTFRGTMDVTTGILTLANGAALGGTGVPDIQTITLNKNVAINTRFALSFGSATTATITYTGQATGSNSDATTIAAALQVALTNAGIDGVVTVTEKVTAGTTVFTVTFGGNLSGFDQPELALAGPPALPPPDPTDFTFSVLQDGAGGTYIASGAALRLQGNITVGGEPLIVQGQGIPSSPSSTPQWFNVGPDPVQDVTIQGGATASGPASGLVSSIAVDPSDPNVVYLTTEGGGAWKTINGGQTWLPIFQATYALYGGAIAVSPSDPRVIYFGSGETFKEGAAPPPPLAFAGTGVYESMDSGRDWIPLTGINPFNPSGTKIPTNPMNGLSVSSIIVDPNNPGRIYVATSDLMSNGEQQANPTAASTVGVWRYDASGWYNMTDYTSTARTPGSATAKAGAPNTPGPDDDYRLFFPQSAATWSSLTYDPIDGVLYAALGTTTWSGFFPTGNPNNAVYRSQNPSSNTPVWYICDGVVNSQAKSEFPTAAATVGNIKITVFDSLTINPLRLTPSPKPPGNPAILYAAITNGLTEGLNEIEKSSDGGVTWAAVKTAPPNYMGSQGSYDSTILTTDGTNVYVGGAAAFGGLDQVFHSPDGGATWNDISVDANGNGPHTDHHALAIDGANVLDGNDGGIWLLNTTNNTWTDLNTTGLSTGLIEGVSTDPNNPNRIFAGLQDNGTVVYQGPTLGWTEVNGGDGGEPQIDPRNPQNVYTTEDGILVKSTTGGTSGSFNQIPASGTPYVGSLTNLYFPYFLDPVNAERLVVGGDNFDAFGNPIAAVAQSLDGGATWTEWDPPSIGGVPGPGLATVSALGVAVYQGTFHPDLPTSPSNPGFPTVTDMGANTDDPNTVYASDGTSLYVTKNHGTTWLNRTNNLQPPSPAAPTITISAIEVDPLNRDHAFVVSSMAPGTGGKRVFMTNNAGVSWTNITSNLPDVPVWSIVEDPRNGFIYVGTDKGVYYSTNGGGTWNVFGVGMAAVQVTSLDLNQNTNLLTAGTFGRGVYQINLSNVQPNGGALSAASGTDVWTGRVQLAGATSLGAEDTAIVEADIAGPQLNIVGAISDLTLGPDYTLTKVGPGNVILSGNNTYGGLTDIQTGSLIVHNPNALGANPQTPGNPGLGTVVENGAALKLQSSVTGEPLTINGNGPGQLNGHNTGALENISGANTYSGHITLANNSTIGVDSGSSLTVSGQITGGFGITKELTGTLVLDPILAPSPAPSTDNSYTGGTAINQGAINIQTPNALGANGSKTKVLDGAQLQVQGGIDVTAQNLQISGTGISGTGALEGVGGANEWDGSVILAQDKGLNPPTSPPANIGIGTLYTSPSDFLLITGTISQVSPLLGINKLGAGTLILNNPNNTYSGATLVTNGALRVQSNGALGTPGTSALQGVIVSGTSGSFTLSFDGASTGPQNVGIPAGTLQSNLNTLLSTLSGAAAGGSVSVGQSSNANGGTVYSISFGGTLGGGNTPLLQATATGGASVVVTSNGTFVLPGGAIEVDGDPIGVGNSLTVSGEGLTVSGNGAPEVQQVSITGAASAGFTLSFNGSKATSLLIGASAGQVTTALNGLSTIGNVGGNVTVTSQTTTSGSLSTTVYTIILGGTLANAHQPAIVATATGTGVTPPIVTIARDGGTGAMHNISGANNWTGPVILQSGGSIGVDPATQLTVSGTVEDPIPSPVPPGTLTKVGAGTLIFADPNTYTGLTQVNAGILNVQAGTTPAQGNSPAQSPLGAVVSEVQSVTLSGPNTGTFNLSFRGQTISPNLPATATAFQLANALAALSTIGSTNGVQNVSVTKTGNTYTVTFQGALAGQILPQMGGSGQLGTTLTITTVQDGSQGTVVTPGATLQVQGGITLASEGLTLSGNGASEVQQVVLSDLVPADTFSLTFNQKTTGNLAPNAGAAAVQAALNGLSSIGPSGFVTVFQTPSLGNIAYTVVFGGSLANTQQSLLGVSQPNATTSPTLSELQVGGIGALDSPSGDNTWSGPITLAGNTWIGADTDSTPAVSTLNLITGITESVTKSALTKVGTGIVQLGGTTSNTYTGPTNVNGGTLQLAKTEPGSGAAVVAVPAALNVGNGTGALLAEVVQFEGNNQIDTGAAVTVKSDGLLDLNTFMQDNAPNNTHAIATLSMTGGTVQLTGASSQLTVSGAVTATSDTGGNPANVTNAGMLDLTATSPTITVNGPGIQAPAPDMIIASPIISATGSFTKAGSGVLQLTGNNTPDGVTYTNASISKGVLLADAPTGITLGDVTLNGGTLGGNNSVNSAQPGTGGTVQPGDSNVSPGILTTNITTAQTWTSSTTFSVVLNDALSPADYSSLTVNGNLALGGATLAGFVGPGVNIGDQYVILTTTNGAITGRFAEVAEEPNTTLGIVFINGQKFDVNYVQTNGSVTSVVITPVRQVANIVLTSSSGATNTSVFGQDVTFTATVTPERGAGAIPATDTVTFSLDFASNPTTYTAAVVWNARAGYGTASFPVSFFGPPTSPLSVGMHQVMAVFNGDNSFQPSNATPLNQTVNKANTTLTITLTPAPPANPVPGQAVTVTATISPIKPGAGVPTSPDSATFTLDGQAFGGPVTLNAAGQAILVLNNLSTGLHRIRAAFPGDADFNSSSSSTPSAPDTLVNVQKAAATVLIFANPLSSFYGQPVTFTANVSGPVQGTGTVSFYNYDTGVLNQSTLLGTATLVNGTASSPAITTLTASAIPHKIVVAYSGSISYLGSDNHQNPFLYTVSPDATQTVLTATPGGGNLSLASPITFTATVSLSGPGNGTPTGTVTFFVDGAKFGAGILNGNATLDIATLATTNLPQGSHTITATYAGTPNFASSTSLGLAENVAIGTTVTGTPSVTSPVYGQVITLTANVNVQAPGTGTVPNGEIVSFTDTTNGLSLGNATLGPPAGPPGIAILPGLNTNLLAMGQNVIEVDYLGDSSYLRSSSRFTVTVLRDPTTTTVSSGLLIPPVLGQTVTLTATVSANSPGSGTPTGTVNFYDGSLSKPIGSGILGIVNGKDVATVPVSTLSGGPHSILAQYADDANFAPSSGTLLLSVSPAQTTTTISETATSSSAGNAIYSELVTFTATVSVTGLGSGTPTGTVTFLDGGVSLGTATLSGGIATLPPVKLAVGTHKVTANYTATTNFGGSQSNLAVPASIATVVVTAAPTNTQLGSSSNPSLTGQSVTITATVTAPSPATAVPSGTVTFTLGSTTSLGTPSLTTQNGQGIATVVVSGSLLSFGSNTINATYNPTNPNPNFRTSTTSLTQKVLNASSTTLTASTSTSSPSTSSVYGQTVTFTVTVSSASSGTGSLTPSGGVNFFDGTTLLNSGGLVAFTTSSNGVSTAVFPFSGLAFGGRSITATYVPNNASQFVPSTSTPALKFTVTQASTRTTMLVPSNTTPVYGTTITLTATVLAVTPGSGTPTGTVTFYDGNTALLSPAMLDGTGKATLLVSTLGASTTHNISAKYNGDTNFLPSGQSASVGVTPTPTNSSTLLSSSADNIPPTFTTPGTASAVWSQAVTFTAVVSNATPGGGGIPTGQVVFLDGNTLLGTGAVNLDSTGKATLVTSSLALTTTDAHHVTATYVGDNNFNGSQTGPTGEDNVTVSEDGTNTTVSSSNPTSSFGQPVTLTATVTADSPGTATPTGTVTFLDGLNTLGTGNLNSKGIATLVVTSLSLGQHSISGSYPGDNVDFTQSTSPSITQNVQQQVVSKLAASLSVAKPNVGTAFTLTVTAEDFNGNRVSTYTTTQPVLIVVLIAPSGGSLTNVPSVKFVNGVAVLGGLKATKAGNYEILIASGGFSDIFTFTAVVPGRQT